RVFEFGAPIIPAHPCSDLYFLTAEKPDFSIGEKLNISLQNQARSLPRGGRLFYAVTRDEAVITDVTAETAFDVYCSEALLPDFNVCAAYFDGKHVFPLHPLAFNYDPAERELRVEILPEKENYEPGAALTAEIRITDALGQPRQASFVLSAADEAAFAALEQKTDAAAAFYRPVYGETAGQFASYTPHSFTDAAVNAGSQTQTQIQAPDEDRREDFRAAAAFLSGRTDGSGRARVTCPLPDDITTWRLTAVAFTEDGHAGDARITVAAAPALFLRPALSSRYTVQGDIALALRADGIPPETAVSYSVRAEGEAGEAAERTVSGEAGAYAVCDFGKLPAGAYKFYITAAAGEWRDEAVYPFSVTTGLPDTPLLTESDVPGLQKMEFSDYPVDLFFYDRSYALYAKALAKLTGAAGARADELMAEEFIRVSFPGTSAGAQAREGLLPAETEPAPAGAPVLRPESGRLPAEYVDTGGGLRLLPYSGPDSLLTARAVAAAPGCLDPGRTRDYFYGILHRGDAAPEETAAAYLGLSALGAPVLTDIRLTLPNERAEFTLRDCLRLAAGLALLGDGAGAAAWYEEFISPLTVSAGGALRVDAGEGEAASYALTAESALLARLIGHSHADALLTYVLEQSAGDYSPLLDIIAVLRFMPAPAGGGSSLRYKLDGKDIQVDLSDIPAYRLRLGQSQFAAADFRAEGAAGVAALYPGAEGRFSSDDSGKITIAKSYAPYGGLVRVTVDVRLQNNAPLALYTLTDTLPAGLRFVGAEAEEGDNWYLSEEDGERVTFVLDRVRENSGAQVDILADFQVTYLARAALTGEFLAGGAVARHAGSGLWAATPPSLQTFQLAR
ncbi:MAG: hypothetical protein LBL37_09465, partial [Gracilibacteraceae bacterium]|nr:hypothetical protein [Gracilibacteraceae bacterium]